jgi:hypothetical protein
MKTGRWTILFIGLFMVFMLTGPVSAADPPAIEWQNVLGNSADDSAFSIRQTADGGYILVGTTVSSGSGSGGYRYANTDVLVIRLDSGGNLVWQKVFGEYADDGGSSIQQTTDGGYILTGYTGTSRYRDVLVLKLDSGGDIQWQKVLGGYAEDSGSGIQQTDDGGYILVGTTASSNSGDVGVNHGSQDIWVVKLDSGGYLQWQKVLGGGDSDSGSGIRQTASGEYILTGYTVSSSTGDVGVNNGRFDVWVVKLDPAGNLQWQNVLGGSAYDYGTGIWPTADGGYVLTGYTSSSNSGDVGENHGANDIWAVRLNSAGDLVWQKLPGGYANDRGYGIQQTDDGGYVLAGYTASSDSGDVGMNHGANDVWVVKLFPDLSALPSTPVTTTPIPSVGQAASTYQVGFDGLSYNADGRNTLDLDLQKARRSMATVAVYSDRVEIYQRAPDGVHVTFKGENFALQGDKITGPVTTADYVTDPVEAPLTPGMVSGSVRASFPSLTQPGMLRTTIGDRPDPSLVDQFRTVMEQNSLAYDTVAYTYDVRKSNMPPAGNAAVTLTLPEQWVNQHGGISAVRIIRVSDTTGMAELVPAIYNGTDKKGMVQFKGISVNGTSVFGLVTLKASKTAQERDPNLTIFPVQQPAISTIMGIISWIIALLQQNPAGVIAIVVTVCAAYAGRLRGMW